MRMWLRNWWVALYVLVVLLFLALQLGDALPW